jgi:hypothetical protein
LPTATAQADDSRVQRAVAAATNGGGMWDTGGLTLRGGREAGKCSVWDAPTALPRRGPMYDWAAPL